MLCVGLENRPIPTVLAYRQFNLDLISPKLHPSTELSIKEAIFFDLGVNLHFEGPKVLIKLG